MKMADYLTILHECKDFPVWRKAYDADAPRRKEAGLTQVHVLREQANSNLLALMFEISDLGRAKAMATSADLAATMQAAGVVGTPRVRLRSGTYSRMAAPGYATMTANVRDFNVSMNAYKVDAADRKAATLTDLGVLQLKDDPNNILLLWAVGDVARAASFFQSPTLAAHMANNAGVIGSPELHFWKD
jgi:hypothetical protein